MTKLEEVARAMWKAKNDIFRQISPPWDSDPTTKAVLLAQARAAIEALRNPPDRVLDAMNPSGRYVSIVIPEAWNDALDAILKEEGVEDGGEQGTAKP